MAQFSFTMPADSIASGVPASDTEVGVDKGFSRQTKQRVLIAGFGDGYEQRVLDGINPKVEVFGISISNRTAEEINEIADFFDAYAAKSFIFTITGRTGEEDITVVCDGYETSYTADAYHSLSAKFRRVYEP
jgi:phage-related protein